MARIWHFCDCGIGPQQQLQLDPAWEPSDATGVAVKRQKEKTILNIWKDKCKGQREERAHPVSQGQAMCHNAGVRRSWSL